MSDSFSITKLPLLVRMTGRLSERNGGFPVDEDICYWLYLCGICGLAWCCIETEGGDVAGI